MGMFSMFPLALNNLVHQLLHGLNTMTKINISKLIKLQIKTGFIFELVRASYFWISLQHPLSLVLHSFSGILMVEKINNLNF